MLSWLMLTMFLFPAHGELLAVSLDLPFDEASVGGAEHLDWFREQARDYGRDYRPGVTLNEQGLALRVLSLANALPVQRVSYATRPAPDAVVVSLAFVADPPTIERVTKATFAIISDILDTRFDGRVPAEVRRIWTARQARALGTRVGVCQSSL